MFTAFIGMGSNLGDRLTNIKEAIGILKKNSEIYIEKISSFIETEPAGGPIQPQYINGVIKIKTFFSPKALLSVLQDTEKTLGREASVRFGPRVIDLDILLYDDKVIDEVDLKIPHPRMFERKFVLDPLFEIEPQMKKHWFFLI